MISTVALIIFSLLLVNIIIFVQSSPIKNSLLQRSSYVVGTSKINYIKKKRNINDDINIKNKLYSKIKETPAKVHDNVDKSILFTDIKMNSNEFKNFVRKRRNNPRPKRDLSTYDLYNSPFYWYPSLSKRNIRSSFYEPKEWNGIYPDTNENNDFYEYEIPFLVDDEDDENDYEYNRYPILSDLSDVPYDNLQLQQEYNIEDLPLDDDDDDGEYFSTRYGPIEDYFK